MGVSWLLLLFVAPVVDMGGVLERYVRKVDMEAMRAKIPIGLYETAGLPTKDDANNWKTLREWIASQTYEIAPYRTEQKYHLLLAGRFLISHRFYEIDRRFEGHIDVYGKKIKGTQVYMNQFPTPPLKELWPKELVQACKKSVVECIGEIARVAAFTSSAIAERAQRIPSVGEVSPSTIIYPLWTYTSLFNFRVTAQYYMCWYTMRRSVELTWFGESCTAWEYDHEAIAYGRPFPMDSRNNDDTPFGCADYMFCPDACCGLPPAGTLFKGLLCNFIDVNPCLRIDDRKCELPGWRNTNLHDLMRNHINVSCSCENINPGFSWNSQFGMCVDIDECFEYLYECGENEVCENTAGGYACPCQHGYKYDMGAKKCKYDHIILEIVKTLATRPPDPPREESSGYTLIDDIKLLFKLFSDASLPVPSPSTRAFLAAVAFVCGRLW